MPLCARITPTRIATVATALAAPFLARAATPADLAAARAAMVELHGPGRPGFALHDTNEAGPEPDRVAEHLASLTDAGAWPDIDYDSKARSSWPPALHTHRLAAIAGVYAHERDAAARARLLEAAHRAFGYWIRRDPAGLNWWYDRIGCPKHLLTAALLLGDRLNDRERRYLLDTVAPRAAIARTGQNRIWLAGNTLMAGLLADDAARVESAAAALWAEVSVSGAEGVQPDYSFHQHGAQQQFGNYGLAYATEIARWARVLQSTRLRLPPERLAVFRRYLLDGQGWISWRGAMDPGACGRQFMPGTPRQKTASIIAAMEVAARLDPEHAAEYRAYVARNAPEAPNDLVGNRYYPRSDYLVHRLPGLMFALKMSSNRVIGAETTNGENLSGYHIADGMLLTHRTGGEYADIFPVWDWRRLPGVTAPQSPLTAFATTRVPRDFVGAVSDGVYGVAALDYAKDGVTARKAWFFGPTGVVALGAGVTGDAPDRVVTGINQCLWRGAVTRTPAGDRIEHDGIRYTAMQPGGLPAPETGAVTGDWARVFRNPATPPAPVTMPLFTLALDHGARPRDAAYAYAIGPAGVEIGGRVVSNTPAHQQVRFDNDRTGIVFWQPGEADSGMGVIRVDTPCLVLIDRAARRITVAEPTQHAGELRLTHAGQTRVVPLPRGDAAGDAATVSDAAPGVRAESDAGREK